MNNEVESLITAIYDMIQDAKALPLGADKCIIERDRALDILDEITARMPTELEDARKIVRSREQLVSQARSEAAAILQDAQRRAAEMVEADTVYQQVLAKSREEAEKTTRQLAELKASANAYMDHALGDTEAVVAEALEQIRQTRSRFQAVTAPENN